MEEHTRAHERLQPHALAGDTLSVPGPGARPLSMFIPARARTRDSLHLVVHFHGAAWLVHQAIDALDDGSVAVVVNLGAGSGVYHRTFSARGDLETIDAFDELLRAAASAVDSVLGRRAPVARLTLSAYSAGHGAVRVLLAEPRVAARVHGVLLLDGLHTSYVPEGRPLAEGGVLDTVNLVALRDYARRAMRGETRLLITHSTIFPGTYASTTETADWLLRALGLRRTPTLEWGPRGMQQLSDARTGGFALLGFAGNSAPDHVDHLHALPELLQRLLRAR